jgi:hypothetical protein
MTKLKSLVAVVALLPLAAFGSLGAGTRAAPEAPAVIEPASNARSSEIDGATAYQCCWVLYMGKWWCVPC